MVSCCLIKEPNNLMQICWGSVDSSPSIPVAPGSNPKQTVSTFHDLFDAATICHLNLSSKKYYNLAIFTKRLQIWADPVVHLHQCDQKKLPNVYKSCPKMISLQKFKIFTPLQNCLIMSEVWAN